MNIKRLLNSEIGKNIVSILLGIGLATLFRKVCTDKNCIVFNGPIISEFEDKIYKHGEKCYKYKAQPDKCDSTKKVIDITNPEPTGVSA
jgi:hypothetical protein|uniref:Uncharacterized protein n=1 Tax=viral metagenome TaxID=1070528 RepID=A0A6C0H392_9ZZZZ